MQAEPVIAVFDVGKTNKKLFLFNEQYEIVFEETVQLPETADEDGFACEDLVLLSKWVTESFQRLLHINPFEVRAINFSAYGASLVHLNEALKPVTPLYNYLKPYPTQLQQQFYEKYGGEEKLLLQTASPKLGMLNSGLQLYWLKHHKPDVFHQIKFSLHLPQFVSYLVTGSCCTDITSIGCHTALWHFQQNNYHPWVCAEELEAKFAPLYKSSDTITLIKGNKKMAVGVGLHDSSAALIPYLAFFQEPFVLISTGTWCISLHPFNAAPLTAPELRKDCLSYLSFQGTPVKASRLFAGHDHEEQTKRLASHFCVAEDFYRHVSYNPEAFPGEEKNGHIAFSQKEISCGTEPSAFHLRNLADFPSYEAAYHQLMRDIVAQQVASTNLLLKDAPVKRIFVDGGFGKNPVYMNLLSSAFFNMEVFAASMAQASALGAALAIHDKWNNKPLPKDLIQLQLYPHPSK